MQESLIKQLVLEVFDFDLSNALDAVLRDFIGEMLILYRHDAAMAVWAEFFDEWLGNTDSDKIQLFVDSLVEILH